MKLLLKTFAIIAILLVASCDKWSDHHENTNALNSLSGIWEIDSLKYYKGSDDTIAEYVIFFDSSNKYNIVINETLNYRDKKVRCSSNLFDSSSQFYLDIDWVFFWSFDDDDDDIGLINQIKFIDCGSCNNTEVFYRYLEGIFSVQHNKKDESIKLIHTTANYEYTKAINIFLTKIK